MDIARFVLMGTKMLDRGGLQCIKTFKLPTQSFQFIIGH